MEQEKRRTYLGDGLYAHHDGFQFWLTSSNGIEDLDSVALEPETLDAFKRFIEKVLDLEITVERKKKES